MEWAKEQNTKGLCMKIDFDKAYDRLEWSFILKMLEWLGFGKSFISSISLLFVNASARVCINKQV